MDPMRALRSWMYVSGAVLGLVVVLAALSAPDEASPGAPARTPAASTFDHDQLQVDANMTQQMSTPSADGPMQRGQIGEDQLDRSWLPGYVRALEQHQADIDRMLARPPR